MGNLNCFACNNSEEVFGEIQSNVSSVEKSVIYSASKLQKNTLKQYENSKDKFLTYSIALFERFNLLRTDPLKFYSESNKYNLSNIFEELINSNAQRTSMTWSTKKEKIISAIMNDEKIHDIRSKLLQIKKNFSREYEIKIYYAKGQFSKIDDALWNVLNGLKVVSEEKLIKLLTNKIDYCVIYSMSEDKIKIDDDSNNKEGMNNKQNSRSVISFFVFFNTKNKYY